MAMVERRIDGRRQKTIVCPTRNVETPEPGLPGRIVGPAGALANILFSRTERPLARRAAIFCLRPGRAVFIPAYPWPIIRATRSQWIMSWFDNEEFWRDLYPYMFPVERLNAAPEQVAQIVALSGISSGNVLDLCCGPGRH